jgi:hypothetical protein
MEEVSNCEKSEESPEGMMTIGLFYTYLYSALDHMQNFTELLMKRKQLETKITTNFMRCMRLKLSLEADVSKLLELNESEINYLADFLILGLLVTEGETPSAAYDATIGKYDNSVERFLAKKLMRDNMFRNLNNQESANIRKLRNLRNLIQPVISKEIQKKP